MICIRLAGKREREKNKMVDLIEFMSSSPLQSIIAIVLFLAAMKGLYESIGWIRKQLEEWYKKRSAEDNAEEQTIERIETLEKNDCEEFKLINGLQDSLNNISDKIDKMRENQDKQSVAMCRASLNAMYPLIKDQGYLTKSQYETWFDLSSIYLESGGNHVFAEKIIPEVNNLQVKDV